MPAPTRSLARRFRESWAAGGNARPAALALALFAAAWLTLQAPAYQRGQIRDTPTYQQYGDAMTNTRVPYRDFGLEYPPAALPVFVLPAALRPVEGDLASYERWFEWEMFLCGAAALVCMLMVLRRVGAAPREVALALGFAALSPLLVGPVILSRFDLWPAALAVAALAALVAERHRTSMAVLGLAFAAKLYPAVVVPIAFVWIWKRAGRREAWIGAVWFTAVVALCFAPFAIVAPHGVVAAMERQTGRPLQIETLGASVLLVAHALTGFSLTVRSSYGSQNLVGGVADALPLVQTALQLVAIVGVWAWFARGPNTTDRLLRAWAAAVCAFVAFGKVLSPQYLIWLIPLVPLVQGRRGTRATALLAAALVLTQLWFPSRYWTLVHQLGAFESSLVLLRDLSLVGLLVVLLAPVPRRGRATNP